MDRVADVEYTVVDTVSEALLLEATLIKRHQPRFNVRLKDDKSYPYIKVTLGDDFPRIERTRKLPNDGSRYFGPYASASSVDEAMNLIRRLFPFRTCTIDIKEGKRALPRPCLLYHIKRCQGPCIEAISKDRLPRRHRAGDAVPGGQAGAGRAPPAPGDGPGVGAARLRAGGRHARQAAGRRANDGEPEDGRLRQDRAGRARLRAIRAAERPCSCSPSATARRSRATYSCWRTWRRPGRRGALRVHQAVLRGGRVDPATHPGAARARRCGRAGRVPRGPPRRSASR